MQADRRRRHLQHARRPRPARASIAEVKREHGAYLLVDEAHSLGVLGANGRGAAEADGIEEDVDFMVGTFSKSLGAIGGFCASDHPDFDVLRITTRAYMFTASSSLHRGLGDSRHRQEWRAGRSCGRAWQTTAASFAGLWPRASTSGPPWPDPLGAPDRRRLRLGLERAAGPRRVRQPGPASGAPGSLPPADECLRSGAQPEQIDFAGARNRSASWAGERPLTVCEPTGIGRVSATRRRVPQAPSQPGRGESRVAPLPRVPA